MQKYKWNLVSDQIPENTDDVLKLVLKSRNIDDVDGFINIPHPGDLIKAENHFSELVNVIKSDAIPIMQEAIKQDRLIIIHGDYDVDGQTSTSILWRTFYNDLGYKNVYPFIPNRFKHGYGLTKEGINHLVDYCKSKNIDIKKDNPLIITVDCGITAVKEIEDIKNIGFQIVLTDHHTKPDVLPNPDAFIWTTKATGAGIAWILASVLVGVDGNEKLGLRYLDLAALGTVCDLQPLKDFNRSVVKFGIEEISNKQNMGIESLRDMAEIEGAIDTYHIGWVLGPRLNAAGRLEDAMDSLRLLSTGSDIQAKTFASKLDQLNKERQDETVRGCEIALFEYKDIDASDMPKILLSTDKRHHDGVIGLVAGKLTGQFYRPSIVIAESDSGVSKGSCRSVEGVSIIDILREYKNLFENVGGHDLAAGFSIKNENIEVLKSKLIKSALEIDNKLLAPKIKIDLELPVAMVGLRVVDKINELRPFGVGNSTPVFIIKNLKITDYKIFGKESNHIKLYLRSKVSTKDASNTHRIEANSEVIGVGFGLAQIENSIEIGDMVDVVCQVVINDWDGNQNIELRIKDIETSSS